jgi:hypothetical protein
MPLEQVRTGVPVTLGRIIARCLRKEPESRYASARALATALAPFARPGGAPLVTQVDTVDLGARPMPPRVSGSRSMFLYLGVALVSGAGLSAALVGQASGGTSRVATSAPTSAPAAVSVVASERTSLAASGTVSAPSNGVSATSAEALARPASSGQLAAVLAHKAKLAATSAVAAPKAAVKPVVIAPTWRFDSSNPYAP